ncbi:glycosyltransferase family 2 protein [Kitasatospora sp. NA04385]|uniref:glycosyltransferase family 2 protein n=1 Tax=Kitasatospora sp. NA04385 TaxID=2742135 RepID=UPI00159144E1|nr:glycosyltransferase family 2 protein [Kitasatospora sp. NA04385]QKW23322.1 glycosyltransferase family 2 protein [Kitasatospora sp. NA04385]
MPGPPAGPGADPRPLLLRAVRYAALAVLVAAPAAVPLARVLRLPGPLPVLLTLAVLVPSTAVAVLWAHALGSRGPLAASWPLLGGASVRLLAAGGALWWGAGVSAVLAATLLGECVAALLLAVRLPARRAGGEPLRVRPRVLVRAVTGFAGLWVLTGADLLCARHWLSAESAGGYGAGAQLAKASLACANLIVLLLIGRLASADRRTATRALTRALGAAVLAGAGVALVLAVGGGTVLPLVFGPGFAVGPGLGLLLGIDATALLVLTVLLHYRAAHGGAPLGGWAGAAAFPPLVALFPATAQGIAAAHALAVLLAVACALPGTGLRLGPRPRAGTGTGRVLPVARAEHELDRAARVEISVVVPYYNPGPAVARHLSGLLRVLDRHGASYEVLAVDDGCTDGSRRRVARLGHRRLRLLGHAANRGKGAALRTGFRQCRGRWIAFIDADGDLPAELLPGLLDAARRAGADAAVGVKHLQHGRVRRLCSGAFRLLARVLFRLPVRDTQTGLKVFRREALAGVLPLCREDGFVFDLELLALLHRYGHRRIAEVPVAVRPRTGSTVRPTTALRMLAEALRLGARLHLTPRTTPAPTDPRHLLRALPDNAG